VNRSETVGALAAALAKAQAKISNAAKAAENPAFKRGNRISTYADLTAVWDACRDQLSSNGLAVVQTVYTEGALVTVTTLLVHSSGEWISGDMSASAQSPNAQHIGSSTTYLRRYSLAAMVGVAPENDDDDGNAARGIESPAGRPVDQAARVAALKAKVRDPVARLEAVKAAAFRTFGTLSAARSAIEKTLGRTFGDKPIAGVSDKELELLESWAALAKAGENAERPSAKGGVLGPDA
jgi:hypothetical protein